MNDAMKSDNFLNLFWAIVWAVVFVFAVLGIFWKNAIYVVIVAAGYFCGMFIYEYVRIKRLK